MQIKYLNSPDRCDKYGWALSQKRSNSQNKKSQRFAGYSSKAVSTADNILKMVVVAMLQEWTPICCLWGWCPDHSVNCSSILPSSKSDPHVFLKQAFVFENRGQEGEVKGHKLDASPVVELVLKLHPEIKHSIKWGNWLKSEKKQRGCKLEIQ